MQSCQTIIVLVSYPDALFEQVITKKELEKKTLTIKVGESIGRDLVNEALFEYDFQRVDFVSQPGEFSVRGGIIDIFSFDKDEPYRIEFFGDEIDRINCFDIETQLVLPIAKYRLFTTTNPTSRCNLKS